MRILRIGRNVARTRGLTLLELVIVMAILLVLSGVAVVTYDRLDKKMAKGRATFDLSAIDRGVRLYKAVTGMYPQDLDLLTLSDTAVGGVIGVGPVTATAGGWFSGLTRELEGADGDAATSDGSLHYFPATTAIVSAFREVGVESVRAISSIGEQSGYEVTNLAYDSFPNGVGGQLTLAPGLVLPIIESKNLGASHSGLLQAIAGLDPLVTHVVVALGLGNNASMVSPVGGVDSATFAEAPYDGEVGSAEYGRFLLLFHLGSDTNGSNTVEESEIFSSALFIGAIDASGDWREQQFREAFGPDM